jgi:hypothetical protein
VTDVGHPLQQLSPDRLLPGNGETVARVLDALIRLSARDALVKTVVRGSRSQT